MLQDTAWFLAKPKLLNQDIEIVGERHELSHNSPRADDCRGPVGRASHPAPRVRSFLSSRPVLLYTIALPFPLIGFAGRCLVDK
jgi:hypothetical protein